MFEIIKELESKGFRIVIIPQMWGDKWIWTAGVYIGDERKAEWIDSNNGLPKAGYLEYKEAFDAVVDYCNNYKPKKHGKKGKV